jgi:hypothetical protein
MLSMVFNRGPVSRRIIPAFVHKAKLLYHQKYSLDASNRANNITTIV